MPVAVGRLCICTQQRLCSLSVLAGTVSTSWSPSCLCCSCMDGSLTHGTCASKPTPAIPGCCAICFTGCLGLCCRRQVQKAVSEHFGTRRWAISMMRNSAYSDSIALTVLENKLYVIFRDHDEPKSLYCATSTDGRQWNAAKKVTAPGKDITTEYFPGLTTLNENVVLAYTRAGRDADVYVGLSPDGESWQVSDTVRASYCNIGTTFGTPPPLLAVYRPSL